MSTTLFKHVKYICLILVISTLAACQSVRDSQIKLAQNDKPISTQQHLSQLDKLQTWSLAGKLAVITPDQRASVYINWKQSHVSDIRMTNILGVSLAKLLDDGHIARLESDGKTYQDTSADALIYSVTGWDLPVSNLKTWIKGSVKTSDQFTLNESELIASLSPRCDNCEQWEINYSNYQKVSNIWLPHKINLSNAQRQTRLKITISEWRH